MPLGMLPRVRKQESFEVRLVENIMKEQIKIMQKSSKV